MLRSVSQILCLTSVAFAAEAGHAVAAEAFALPAGCEAYVTMQKKSCIVSHLFTCENDAEGYQRRVDLGANGLQYIGTIDAEAQWVESYSGTRGTSSTLVDGAVDPASFSELVATGADVFDFETVDQNGVVTRYVGEDRLTGKVITIDGVELTETQYKAQVVNADGSISEFGGNEYIVPEWRSFVSGTRTVSSAEGDVTVDYTPVEFAFPGEAGFLAANPIYDCGATTSKAPRP